MSASENQIVVYQPNETVRLDVRLENETVWLTQSQMATLFGCSTDNIGLHLKNVYSCGELDKEATTEESSVVQIEGRRKVSRKVCLYNLDAIISVGYRVNSVLEYHGVHSIMGSSIMGSDPIVFHSIPGANRWNARDAASILGS